MMRKVFKITLFVGVFILGQNLPSLASDKVGTTGAAFLKIPCGARAIGMGGAFGAVADDASCIYWNPAGLVQLTKKEATFTYLDYFEEMSFGYVGYAHPTTAGTFGWAISYLGHEKIEGYDVYAKPTGGYQANDTAIALSYARGVGKEFSLGGNIKYINEKIEDEQATGFAIDLGGLYKIENFSLGLAVQNLGTEIKFVEKGDPLPLNFRLSTAYRLFNDKFTLAVDGNLPNDKDTYFNVGGEYWILSSLAARVGYRGGPKDEGNSVCGGIGLRWKNLGLDFAYEPYGRFGDTYYYSLITRF
ncbi:MAG: PorV/PorQ family protein [bacterium]|nr:PorV/PorQ family protein [bacterium]